MVDGTVAVANAIKMRVRGAGKIRDVGSLSNTASGAFNGQTIDVALRRTFLF